MAVELGTFLRDQLERLPSDHPERAYIANMLAQTEAYIERKESKIILERKSLPIIQRNILEKIYDILQENPERNGVFGLEIGKSLNVRHIGSVYKSLSRLDRLGLISTIGFESASGRGPARHIYNITEVGTRLVVKNRADAQR